MKKNGLLISVLAVGVLVLIALILNLAQGGMWIISGRNGKSAYELAVQNGYQGTLQEWLDSLAGSDGHNGSDGMNGTNGANGQNGKDGTNGTDGKSAYELAVENGFRGSLQEWILSLSFGADGKDGKDGTNGKDGVNGKDGKDGENGKDGVSIVNVYIDSNSRHLIVVLSDGSRLDAGSVGDILSPSDPTTPDEKNDYQLAVEGGYTGTLHEWLCSYNNGSRPGVSVKDILRTEEGELLVVLNDDKVLKAGKILENGDISASLDANGFRPRFEMVVMNSESGGLNLRAVPNDTTSAIVASVSTGAELVCLGLKDYGNGDIFYQFYRNGQLCYARAKFFDLKYDYMEEFPGLNLPDKLVIRAGETFRFVTEEIMPWADQRFTLVYEYSNPNSKPVAEESGIAVTLTPLFRDGTSVAGHPEETETLTVTLCMLTEQGPVTVGDPYTITVTVCAPAELPALTGLVIGDSRVSMGGLLSSLTQGYEGLNLIGTLRNDAGIACEGRGGWKAANFWNNQHIGTGENEVTNAFYNPADTVKHFDFSYYMAQNYPDTKLDFVVINLGANDGYTIDSVNCIKKMIDSIHAFDPEIRVLVMTEYIAPERDKPYYADRTRRAQFRYFSRLEEEFAGKEVQNIYLLPNFLCVDTFGDRMLKQDENGNQVISDYVHLGAVGYGREADVIISYLSWIFGK